MPNIKSRNLLWLALVAVVVFLDLWTKSLATAGLDYGVPVEILPIFNLTLQHNSGAAFSFLSDAGGWQRWFFSAIAVVVGLFILAWLLRLQSGQKNLACSLSLILGGAIGNLWDRVELGYVVDFISVHYQSWYFPAFNIADSAITIGAVLMLLDMFIHPDNHSS